MTPAADNQTKTTRRRSAGQIWFGVAAVAALAVVIFVGSSLSASEPETNLSGLEQQSAAESDGLYAQATQALQSGDSTAALDFANQALAINPNNRRATALVAKLSSRANRPLYWRGIWHKLQAGREAQRGREGLRLCRQEPRHVPAQLVRGLRHGRNRSIQDRC